MPMLPVDLSALPAGVRKRMHEILSDQNAMEIVKAKIRQRQIAQFHHQNRPRAMDGIGPKVMAVDPYFVSYWRMKQGADCWDDPDFVKWLAREEEAVRVRAGGTKTQVGYSGPGPARPAKGTILEVRGGNVRSRKTYAV